MSCNSVFFENLSRSYPDAERVFSVFRRVAVSGGDDDQPVEAAESPRGYPHDRGETRRFMEVAFDRDRTYEIRALAGKRSRRARSRRVSLRDVPAALDVIEDLAAGSDGIYYTLNPVLPELDNRAAKDVNVLCRRLILIDCDPTKPKPNADESAADDEKQAALDLAAEIKAFLASVGFPPPIEVDSGNGAHLLYLCDLPNDAATAELIKRFLAALAGRFDSSRATVDRTVYNASRIAKLPGTWARKGTHTLDRPHRLCRMTAAPDVIEAVSAEQIERTALQLASGATSEPGANGEAATGSIWQTIATKYGADVAERVKAYLAKLPPAISGQKGSNVAFRAACIVVRFGITDPDVIFALLQEWNGRCEPPWSEAELRHKIGDAIRTETRRDLRDATPTPMGTDGASLQGDDAFENAEIVDRWPNVPREMFYGVAGDVSMLADPHTEADPVATLIQFLVAVGNMLGRTAYFQVGATRHCLNLFVVLVGLTAVGRKGTSWDVVRWLIEQIDPGWANERIQSGIVSGEGMIYHVRDERWEEKEVRGGRKGSAFRGGRERVLVDAGISDKRLLVQESEFSRPLKAANRDSNTISDVVRQLWEKPNAQTLGKNHPVRATGAHVSIIGHSTQSDIKRHLSDADAANGFANRFLWILSRRSKLLPDGGDLESVDWTPIVRHLADVRDFVRGEEIRMVRDPGAQKLWRDVYPELSCGKPGLLGAVTSRAEAQVLRLSCLYAILDRSCVISEQHVVAALALWRYCEDSARLIFGAGGDSNVEKLLDALRETPGGLTRKQIGHDVFKRNIKAATLTTLLSDLLTQGAIHRKSELPTKGRPAERWFFGSVRGNPRAFEPSAN
jgi:Protein of unknown function (DUF3987)